MKNLLKNIGLGICIISLAIILQACEQEGPAEEAGEQVDTMLEDAQERFEEASEKMGDMVEQGKQQIEEAGEKMDDMIEQGGEQLEEAGEEMQQ